MTRACMYGRRRAVGGGRCAKGNNNGRGFTMHRGSAMGSKRLAGEDANGWRRAQAPGLRQRQPCSKARQRLGCACRRQLLRVLHDSRARGAL